MTLAEAEAFIETYFARMPGVKEYIDRTKAFVWENGYTETLYGRRRIYPAIRAKGNRRSTAAEERAAINMPIQGTAADILKQSMIDLDARLAQSDYDAAMILQVHDELVLEVKEDQLDPVKALVVRIRWRRLCPMDSRCACHCERTPAIGVQLARYGRHSFKFNALNM